MSNDNSKKQVGLSVSEDVAYIRLQRGGGNALDRALIDEFADTVSTVGGRKDYRALILSGEGGAFCVGGDIQHFVTHRDNLVDELDGMAQRLNECILQLATLPVPVVVAAQGGIGGGALGFLWCADYVIAAEDCKLATGYVDIGLSADAGNSWYLPRLVGMRRAKELLLENRVLDAETALEWGLVNQVVPTAEVLGACEERARKMASRSISGMARMKKLLAESGSNDLNQQLQVELKMLLECAAQGDVKSGINAFINKEKPNFNDR